VVALVTGCRSGIGLWCAVELARSGHKVYAGLRDLATRQELDEACEGLDVVPVQLDVTVPAERSRVVERIVGDEGRLDILVNNAGVAVGGFLELVQEDELRRVLEVNVIGVFALTQLCLPHLRVAGAADGGWIFQISSMAGRMAFPGLGAYATSKFALEGMSEALRHELAPFGVRVALIEPGAYRTAIWTRNRTIGREARQDGPYLPYAQRVDTLLDRVVDKKARHPREIGQHLAALVRKKDFALRHPMGEDAWLRSAILKFLPFCVVEWVLGLAMKPR